jgi:hypothetical protein
VLACHDRHDAKLNNSLQPCRAKTRQWTPRQLVRFAGDFSPTKLAKTFRRAVGLRHILRTFAFSTEQTLALSINLLFMLAWDTPVLVYIDGAFLWVLTPLLDSTPVRKATHNPHVR